MLEGDYLIMKVVLFTKTGKPTINEAINYLRRHFDEVIIYTGKRTEPLPAKAFDNTADVLISYISPWIIPRNIMNKTKRWNINFHPGPPEYPGIGCSNFAIYNGEKNYGVTAHLMDVRVDRGKIIGVRRFPLLETDSVYELTKKSYEHMLSLFYEVMGFFLEKDSLPSCDEHWQKLPYRRKELENLCKITKDMTREEIRKRIKATTYPGMPGAYINLYGYKFKYSSNRDKG